MAYSGTVGTTVVTVQNFIDQGARLAGKLAEELTGEQVVSAKQALFFVLSNLINQGINYWAIDKVVYGLQPNQNQYLLPVGGNDVLNALYRTMTRPTGSYSTSAGGAIANLYDSDINTYCQQTSADGNFVVNFGSTQHIGSIGFMPYVANNGTAIWNYYLQSSVDGVTWTTLYTGTNVPVSNGTWVFQDLEPGANVAYYRIQAFGGTTLALFEWYLGTNSTEIPMARLNRDDYTNLPNKSFTSNNPYQFWFNRQLPQAKITLWPTPSNAFVQMTVWYSRQIEDVGALSGQLEIPQRWNQAIQFLLGHQMSMILPGVQMDRIGYLEGQAEKYFIMAESEERDRSPIFFSPNISVYTK